MGSNPRERRTGGYNRKARSEHPDVSVLRRGEGYVLRYVEPGSGLSGKPRVRQELLKTADGQPITSKAIARDRAAEKSQWLMDERLRIKAGATPIDRDAGWADLKKSHDAKLQAGGSSPKTKLAYDQAWKQFESWPRRPGSPSDLSVTDLQAFMAHLRSYWSLKTNAPLSKHSVAAHARHVRAILNYGRKVVHCIRLDGEAVGEGLSVGRLPRLLPESYDSAQLCELLQAAREYDAEHPRSQVFPFIAFLMVVGCRLGEAESLRWAPTPHRDAPESWVDFKGRRIVIFGRKTQVERTVPLDVRPQLTRMLKRLKARIDPTTEPYVFGGAIPLAVADKRRISDPNKKAGRSLKSAIDSLKDKVDFHWSPHSLRANLATYLANSSLGSNLYVVAGELGHDYAVLVKHYAGRRKMSRSQLAAKSVEALLGVVAELNA